MFDFVRQHNKVLQFLLFLLIFPSFVLFGVEGYSRFNDKGAAVARVDGQDISQTEWDAAHKNEVDRLRQSMPNLDAKLLDTPQARYATLERLVRDRVLLAAAQGSRLTATDQRVATELQQDRVIASLKGADGKLDMARYRQLLAQQGLTPEMYENQLRSDLSMRQVMGGLIGTGFASTPADVALGAFLERREVQVARFDSADYAPKVTLTDADIEAFYKENPQLFQAPEQASIEYVMLDVETLKKGVAVNEQDLKTYYDQNVARNVGPEERRASHILIASAKTEDAAERTKKKAKAEELLAAVKKAPGTFADLARKHSQDPGSAAKGGDLDFFTRGAMVKPVEDAVFSMKTGDISGVVESDFGFHIIKLADVKIPKPKTFEEVRPELEAELKKQQAQRKFAESAEAFSNAVYEQSDGLKAVAERFKLEVRTANGIARQPAQGATGALANAKFLNALFSPDSLEKKRNTEAVEVVPGQLVSGRVVQHSPARTLALEEVKDRVREQLKARRASEMARKAGADQLAAWKANPAAATLPAVVVISREQSQKLPPSVVDAALRADPAGLPGFVGVDLGAEGYAVVKVNKSLPRETPNPGRALQEREQYVQWWSSAEGLAYYNLLKERFKVQIKAPKPEVKPEEQPKTS